MNASLKKILLLLLFCSSGTLAFCQAPTCNDFVKIDGKKFKCGTSDFFAVVTNYVMEVVHTTGANPLSPTTATYFPSRYHSYSPDNMVGPEITNATNCSTAVYRDFAAMKSKGFNCVRVVGISFGTTCTSYATNPCTKSTDPGIGSSDAGGANYQFIPLTSESSINFLLDMYEKVLEAAKAAEIKVILLLGGQDIYMDNSPTVYNQYITFLGKFAARFKYNSSLLAVDFVNEPTPTGFAFVPKKKACEMTKAWYNAIKGNSRILTTIGLGGVESTMFWDPNMLSVDFISLHHYPHITDKTNISDLPLAIDNMKSDYYWYKNNVKLPWIIGETGMSAHPNNTTHPINVGGVWDQGASPGTLTDQATFLTATLNASRDYGATGYSWWTYMDEDVHGYTTPNKGPFWGLARANEGGPGSGTIVWKPAADAISSFNPTPNSSNAVQPLYYTNYRNFPYTYVANGRVLEAGTSNPITNAYVAPISSSGLWLNVTYTDSQGYFTLRSDEPITRIQFLATECSSLDTAGMPELPDVKFLPPVRLTKINRPTTVDLVLSNQTINNANSYYYASNSAEFNNYVINSGNFTVNAASAIKLKTGFSSKNGSNFNARITPYFHDCNSIKYPNGTIFKTAIDPEEDVAKQDAQWKIYPNPSTGMITVSTGTDVPVRVSINNLMGQQIVEKIITVNNEKIDLSSYGNGIYFVTVYMEDQAPQTTKIIINK